MTTAWDLIERSQVLGRKWKKTESKTETLFLRGFFAFTDNNETENDNA